MNRTRRQLAGSIGGHMSWANTVDRTARTAPGRRAFDKKFEHEVDPNNTLTPAERSIRAGHARKAYFQQLALASAKSRARNKNRNEQRPTVLVSPAALPTDPLARAVMVSASLLGWTPLHPSEARVAIALHQLGYLPLAGGGTVAEQFRVGAWRLDFAIPSRQIAIEADGWVHTAESVRTRDAVRDIDLARRGWRVVRVNTDNDDAVQQLALALSPTT